MVVFLLLVIAIGVLLMSPEGKSFLAYSLHYSLNILKVLTVLVIISAVVFYFLSNFRREQLNSTETSFENKEEPLSYRYTDFIKLCEDKTTPTPNSNSFVSIDENSMRSIGLTTTVSGTYTNIEGALEVIVWEGEKKLLPTLNENNESGYLYRGSSDHGGPLFRCTTSGGDNGRFLLELLHPARAFNNNVFTVGVYNYKNIYTANGYIGDTEKRLVSTRIIQLERAVESK